MWPHLDQRFKIKLSALQQHGPAGSLVLPSRSSGATHATRQNTLYHHYLGREEIHSDIAEPLSLVNLSELIFSGSILQQAFRYSR